MTATPTAAIGTATSLRAPLLAGAVIGLAFFAGLGGWAATAPLAGAAVAPGIVGPDGSRKTVQHLEGGIVRALLVQDGSRVAAGAPLVRLDDTQARAEYRTLLKQARALGAAEARLVASRTGAAAISFDRELLAAAEQDSELRALLASEREQLASTRAALADRRAVLVERIARSAAEIRGRRAEIEGLERQRALLAEEAGTVEELVRKNLERRARWLGLARNIAAAEAAAETSRAAIQAEERAIAEAEAQLRSLDSTAAEEAARERATVRGSLASLGERLAAARDRLERTLVTAPVGGTVVELRFRTPGGVVRPGEPIMDLVPLDDELLIEARVAPVDIDEVHPGQPAQVHLLAYRSRALPRLDGVVRTVSADRLVDPATHQPYYAVRVALDAPKLHAAAPEVSLAPGMPAEVLIMTGERTFLDYLLQPAQDALRRGLRES